MKSLKFVVGLTLLLFLLAVISCGDDDKNITNPGYTMPAGLVGTWWYLSGTNDGVPIPSFASVSMTDTSQAGSVTLNSNDTYSSKETYNSQIVFTQSGLIRVKGDTLRITRTILNGSPAPAHDTSSSLYSLTADTLILTNNIETVYDTVTIIIKYLRE